MFITSISQANNITIESNVATVRSNGALSGLVLGETIEATVLEKLAGNKYILAWKNQQASAISDIPLNRGEKLLVRVDNLQPQIFLNIIDRKSQNNAQINEKLLQWRMNPESFLQVIDKFAGLAKLFHSGEPASAIFKSDLEKLIKLFEKVIFSPRTMNNPLFLKEFVSRIGLIQGNSLKQLVAGMVEAGMENPQEDNLKTLLQKIAISINAILRENPKLDDGIMAKLVNIASFTDDAINTLEVHQIINSVFQESENGLMLQIPIALADGFRLADIFITPEGKNPEAIKKFSSCSVAIFLDLDCLGKIAVKANVREGSFNCVIKCEKEEVKNLISSDLDKLKNSLAKTGYQVGYIDCIQEEGLMQKKEEFLSSQSFFADNLVNFFV